MTLGINQAPTGQSSGHNSTVTTASTRGGARYQVLAYQVLAALNAPQGPGNKQRAKELCGRLIDELRNEQADLR